MKIIIGEGEPTIAKLLVERLKLTLVLDIDSHVNIAAYACVVKHYTNCKARSLEVIFIDNCNGITHGNNLIYMYYVSTYWPAHVSCLVESSFGDQ